MNMLTNLFGFFAALSLATERITETIKGLPILSGWLAVQKPPNSQGEAFRKACVQILAIAVGTGLTYLTKDQLSTVTDMHYSGFWTYLLLGAMSSGGSGVWNSALDIVREVSQQKELLTQQMQVGSPKTGAQ
jgi:hypothetical protein